VSKIIRTVRVAGPVVTLGQAERDLYLRNEATDETAQLDLAKLVAARVGELRQGLEETLSSRHQEAMEAAESAAAQRLEAAQSQAAAELERVAQQRHQEGYQEGLDQREAEAREAVERMGTLHEALKQEHGQILREADTLIVDVAVAVAERIVRARVDVDRTVVARIVHAALDDLAAHGLLEIHVHPDDLQVARRFAQRWVERVDDDAVIKVRGSEHISRGGCMIEGADQNVDARLERQLAALRDALQEQAEGSTGEDAAPTQSATESES
jgi:flagellar assembly protein FliH